MQVPSKFLCISEGGQKSLRIFQKSCPFHLVSLATNWGGIEKHLDFSATLQIYRLFAAYQLEGCSRFGGWQQSVNFIEWGVFLPFSSATTWGDKAIIRNLNTTPIMYSAYLITAPTNQMFLDNWITPCGYDRRQSAPRKTKVRARQYGKLRKELGIGEQHTDTKHSLPSAKIVACKVVSGGHTSSRVSVANQNV